jgi:RimJ/RimL family protein N-acetyltransferase
MIVLNDPTFGLRIIQAAGATDFDYQRDVSLGHVGKLNGQGVLLGGVVFQDYTGKRGSVGIHCAGFLPGWLSRALLWHTFHFAFDMLEVKKIVVRVPASNYKALKLDEHLGFTFEAKITDVFPAENGKNADLMILGMYRDQCRWLDMPKPNTMVLTHTKTHKMGTRNG